ncbi:MAG: DUF4912 domain-containing protein [Clostridia bacterium]|nr:DUF4912 domain-containing protein [Clostridia bacterium]
MLSKKKTTADEESSTKKKGITKTNTIRTQKITAKAKSSNKRSTPSAKKIRKDFISKFESTSNLESESFTEFAKALETINKLTAENNIYTKKEPIFENESQDELFTAFADALDAINKLTGESDIDTKKEPIFESENQNEVFLTFAEALEAINKLTAESDIDTKKEPIFENENQAEIFTTFADALDAINKLTAESEKTEIISEKRVKTNKSTKTKIKSSENKKSRTKTLSSNDNITSSTPLVEKSLTTEYYDLPFTYGKTVVKILAQTPEVLFVYWDISEEDRKKFVETYGENFFNETKPVLIITNKTMNYTFEVDINDFANSWYLHVNDAKCEYTIELGRRPISQNINIPNNYLCVTSSNEIEAPNDHILFEKAQNMVYFRNVKTNVVSSKSITSLSLLKNMGKIYNIYDFYKKIYNEEDFKDASRLMGNSSSVFK